MSNISAQHGKDVEEYKYYFDQTTVASYEEAVSKCAELNATLATIKTKEFEDIILAQGWQS